MGNRFNFNVRYLTSFFLFVIVMAGVLISPAVSASTETMACELTDESGQLLRLPKAAHRIISLSPSITELLFDIGADDRVVGVSKYSDYPDAASLLPVVSDYYTIDMEMVLDLKPDLVVAWTGGRSSESLRKLSALGIPVYYSDMKVLADIPKTMRDLGCLAGRRTGSIQSAERFDSQYGELKANYQNRKSVSVFYQMNAVPLLTVTHRSIINEVIRLCAGRNVFSFVNGYAPLVSIEEVLERNPEVMVSATKDSHWVDPWKGWSEIKAVKNNAFVTIDPDEINRMSPRILSAALDLCKKIANRGRFHHKAVHYSFDSADGEKS